MLNYITLLEYQLLVITMVKMDILSHNAKLKEKIKEKKEETQAIIKITTKDITQIITQEKEPQDLITDPETTNENKETDPEVVKEIQTILEIGTEMTEAEAAQETLTRIIERVNTNEPLHPTLEMSITLIMIKMKMNPK